MKIFVFLLVITLIWYSCKPDTPKISALSAEQLEAIEDSLEFVAARALQNKIGVSITADVETRAVNSPQVDDDAADDMAIWYNAAHPEKSTFIGTNKKGGVMVYNLQGEDLFFYPTGRINNIDVMYACPLGKEKTDLVGCTNRSDQSVDLFRINPADGTLVDIAAGALKVDTNLVKDVYGFCFYHSDKPYVFLSGKNGAVQQFEIVSTSDGRLDLKLVRTIFFASQIEGLVTDEVLKVLYIGEEDRGIWKILAEPKSDTTRTLLAMSGADNPNITYDVEGLALYKKQDGSGYLLASSQGNFSYSVFERTGNNRYLGSFKISDGISMDGVEETDGIEAVNLPLGPNFPKGLFAAQDGFNYDSGKLQRQNFKILRWEKIEALFIEK